VERRTLGGMRVERLRFCMKLILTAGAQLASIAFSLRSGPVRVTYQGETRRWSGDGGRAVGGEVRGRKLHDGLCRRLRQATTPASSRRHHHRSRFPPATSTTQPPCLPCRGQLDRDSSPQPFGPPRRGPWPRHFARIRPTNPLPTATRSAPKMRPLSSSPATRPRSARKAPPRE
jgi:hypothetical protein